jgi:hypothetical protein
MKILFLVALIASSFVSVLGQGRIIGQAEFDAVVKDDKEQARLWTGKSYRIIVSTSSNATDKPESTYSSNSIIERAASGSSRSRLDSTFNGKTTTTETLRVGNSSYHRDGTEPWKKVDPKESKTEQMVGEGSPDISQNADARTEYRYLGRGEWKGENVSMYLRTERRTEPAALSGNPTDLLATGAFWINADGLILKAEYRFMRHSGDRSSRTEIFIERAPCPDLVITEPQILPQS